MIMVEKYFAELLKTISEQIASPSENESLSANFVEKIDALINNYLSTEKNEK